MSRYGGGDYSPRGGPTERWDSDRFTRESSGRGSTVIERDHFEEHDRYGPSRRRDLSADHYTSSGPSRGSRGGYEEEDRFYEREDRYGPPARREPPPPARSTQRRYYEEEDYEEESPRRFSRGGRGAANPPRPGMLVRRQSSLDTFDRRPMRHREPEVVQVPAPRGGRREERHRYEPRYAEREYEEMDIRIAEPDRYGDDGFRGWKEREVETIRRRRGSSPHEFREREEQVLEEKPWPRRGRTRMSARLVNKRALVQLGYPFEDELADDGDYVVILKALNKELIDEVLGLSKEFNARTTFAIEAPASEREIIERREIVIPAEPAEVPRSVREWDVMSGTIGGGGKSEHGGGSVHGSVARSHKSRHSHHRSRSAHHSHSTVKGHSRSPSPIAIIERRSKSRHRSRSSAGHRKVDGVEEEEIGESNQITTGPLALVLPHRDRGNSRDERKVKEEIRELEAEKRRLKKERHGKKHHHHHHHKDSSSSDDDDEVIIERVHKSEYRDHGGEKIVKVEKDRKAGPDSKLVKAMFATLT